MTTQRRSRSREKEPVTNLSPGKARRRKPIKAEQHMTTIKPLTENQNKMFRAFEDGKNLFIGGCPGTGKSFIALYLSLYEALSEDSYVDQVYVVRSAVPTRDIGFLPGTKDEKMEAYTDVYSSMIAKFFQDFDAPEMMPAKLVEQGSLVFLSTSFLRGATFDNSIVVVDECQNMSYHELATLVTRMGENSRIIFCGDFNQTDLKRNEQQGWTNFVKVINEMPEWFSVIFMDIDDIVRSKLCKAFVQKQVELNLWVL